MTHVSNSLGLRVLFKRLWRSIDRRRKIQIGCIFCLMVIASFFELIGIGAVIPLLGVLTDPERIFKAPWAQPMIIFLGYERADQLLFPLIVGFSTVALLSGFVRLLLVWGQTKLGHAIGADFSSQIYKRTLYQPYQTHLLRNSSEVVAAIASKADAIVYAVILPSLLFSSSALITAAIMCGLLIIEPTIAISAFIGFTSIYAIIVAVTRKQVRMHSQRISREEGFVIKALQEGLGGIRDVLIDGTQDVYCETYMRADRPLRQAHATLQIIAVTPRYGIEALGMVLIALLAYFLAQRETLTAIVPVLGALALGAQRLLPSLQQGYASWTTVCGASAPLRDALDLIEQPLPDSFDEGSPPLCFKSDIQFKDVSFRYSSDGQLVLKNVSLKIPKGSKIGLMGATGSGKSTLVDVFMGLLTASQGQLCVDSRTIAKGNQRAWQRHIAHVPQMIFLADSTIAENIAFGVPAKEIDYERVKVAAKKAQIAETVESWPQKYQTRVGERGIRLSGGQRQRIGIARALYKRADVIVLDEATSALDHETEAAVMREFASLDEEVTILMVAHRLSTLRNCDIVIRMSHGEVVQIGSYDQVIKKLEQ